MSVNEQIAQLEADAVELVKRHEAESHLENRSNFSASGIGQQGSGTDGGLPAALAPNQANEGDVILETDTGFSHDAMRAGSIAAAGANAETAVAAAMSANAAPAPSDPLETAVQNLHERLAGVENDIADTRAEVASVSAAMQAFGSANGLFAKLQAAFDFIETAKPLLTRIETAFNTHFSGKI